MGTRGRKRKQARKAKNRTGLIKRLSGPMSSNQHDKRQNRNSDFSDFYTEFMNKLHNS